MDLHSILGGLFLAFLVLAGLRWYYEYRRDLNKKEKKARLEKRDFQKPTVVKDVKKGFWVIVLIIIGSFALLVVFNILHLIFPDWFPDSGFR